MVAHTTLLEILCRRSFVVAVIAIMLVNNQYVCFYGEIKVTSNNCFTGLWQVNNIYCPH